ncbi:endonuclease G, mitochondrial [Cupriavidus metallidurans]|uniref:Endonuclease n=2 Tax=Cupriavidus metallidurans (strain ATCC 43123 / DSM 2839 / NBRC 102507 / CH34) TaxID=266264 RepID=Q1L9P9_CUPMC|nr:DNA/RNA non-specific endonuclease [Cupriavidus metallidurans]ABF13127.1 DNA/RNA non-specific endonuclease [Cupriavidus metallidurans CH34]
MFNDALPAMIRQLTVALLLAVTAAAASAKDAAQCGNILEAGKPAASRPAANTKLLCYRAYAVLYSPQTRTALWSAERLTAAAADAARTLPRDSDFYEEDRLPAGERAQRRDFVRSGYDRGHLAPSGDFGDKASQAESFSLANVVPQNSTSNRRTWSHIETSTRKLARQYGAIHVVTGPAFTNAARMLNGRVRIPDYLWKAIYVPGVGAAAYVVRNDATQAYSVISISELSRFTGIDPFPALAPTKRGVALDLPPPTPHPGEKAARRVAFARLVGNDKAGDAAESLGGLVQHAGALATLMLAYAR